MKAPVISILLLTASAISSPAADARTKVIAMNGKNGNGPTSAPSCIAQSSGSDWCYGTTYVGGANNYGSLYKIRPNGSKHTILASFDVSNGLTPSQQPVLSPSGNYLFGTTSQAGTAGSGTIYQYELSTGALATIASFTGNTGTTPQAPPIMIGDILYGVTGQSGANGVGTIWAFDTKNQAGGITHLRSFEGGLTDVATPFGALTFNPQDGLLYGMAFNGGANKLGGIFSINLDGSNYKLRASFRNETGGVPQMGALLLASDGYMYGNGWVGGANDDGTIFKFDPITSTISPVFNYTQQTGTQPYGGVAESPSGEWLYAATWKGGKNGIGTLVAVRKDGSESKVLINFNKNTGGLSTGGVTLDSSGKYIMAVGTAKGKHNIGTLISLEIPKSVQ